MTDSRFLKMIVFVLLVVVSSCTHETKEPEPVPCPYNSDYEEMKDWYYFKEGTYWVYKEENSGSVDTITVVQAEENTNQYFEWWGQSTHDGYNYIYYFDVNTSAHCIIQPNCQCNKIYRVKGSSGNYVGESAVFIYPHIENNYNNTIGFPNGQLSTGQSVLVNSITDYVLFNGDTVSVCRWEVSVDGSNSGFSVNYEVGYRVGVVRIEYPMLKETWVLKEMNILQ